MSSRHIAIIAAAIAAGVGFLEPARAGTAILYDGPGAAGTLVAATPWTVPGAAGTTVNVTFTLYASAMNPDANGKVISVGVNPGPDGWSGASIYSSQKSTHVALVPKTSLLAVPAGTVLRLVIGPVVNSGTAWDANDRAVLVASW